MKKIHFHGKNPNNTKSCKMISEGRLSHFWTS